MLIECLPFQNVVATGKATINFSNLLGYTVESILLELGGTSLTKAMLTDIDFKANTKTIMKDTGTIANLRMSYRGETADAAYLALDFSELKSKTIQGQRVGAIDTTAGIQSLTGEITITGATAPTLSAFAEVSPAPQADPQTRGLIAKVLQYTVSPAASGTFPFDLPYGRAAGCTIKRVHLYGSTVTAAEVKKNGITIHKATNAVNRYSQTRNGRSPQTSFQTIDFIKDGNQSSALNMANANSQEWYMTVSGSGNVTVIAEIYDPLNNN